ncbi:HEAT repeat domain-containing protein [Streptomyces sp. BI20]|uniref:HEAT repeat domain-containing protein n=1 Tax=Streptomyces sp. BI20 TaxID=3403460 RepID=UPI003C72405A
MFDNMDEIDWSAFGNFGGDSAAVPEILREMLSPHRKTRNRAFGRFYCLAHDVEGLCGLTPVTLPFLFAIAADPAAPDRRSVVELLFSIGQSSLERLEGVTVNPDGSWSIPGVDCLALVTAHADDFLTYAQDPDPHVRRPAISAIGLFGTDAVTAAAVLRERLEGEATPEDRERVVSAMGDLAARLPQARDSVVACLDAVTRDEARDPETRFAALVHRVRCVPDTTDEDTVSTAVDLLRELTPTPPPGPLTAPRPVFTPHQITYEGIPYGQYRRDVRTDAHAPTSPLLRILHEALDGRLPERKRLLTAQFDSPHQGTRYDAIRMADELVREWRGDHTGLVCSLAGCLHAEDPYLAGRAASSMWWLDRRDPSAEAARVGLAAFVAGQRAVYGDGVWGHPDGLVRETYRDVVAALARLGDARALPDVLSALDSDDDNEVTHGVWLVEPLQEAADVLVPRLRRRLGAGATEDWSWRDPTVSTLVALSGPEAVPVLLDAIGPAVAREHVYRAKAAIRGVISLGPEAVPDPAAALAVLRPVTGAEDTGLRAAAAVAVWQFEGWPEAGVPGLVGLFDCAGRGLAVEELAPVGWDEPSEVFDRAGWDVAVDALARSGQRAAVALPALRRLAESENPVERVYGGCALWDVGGEAEAGLAMAALLSGWEELPSFWDRDPALEIRVLACLERMGSLAVPAAPLLRAEIARPRRRPGHGVAADETLLRACRAVLAGLGHAA